jgi:hypothetical protein
VDLLVVAADSGKPIIPAEAVTILAGNADEKKID